METLCFAVGVLVGLILKRGEKPRKEEQPQRDEAVEKWAQKMSQQFMALQAYDGMPQEGNDE